MLLTFSVSAQNVLSLSESLTDQAIILPESFEADTHKMLQNWYLKNYAVLDAGAEYTQDITVTDAELTERLSKLPVEIEMPFNSVVKSIINAYTQRRRVLVENMLGLGLYYNPIFEEALEREGMPLELKYLPVIESALNPDAVSRVGATGLWQFMTPTAKGLGLEVNSIVDERRDPVKSSQMAARYLKELYTIYGNWSLAIAAYNCGPGNVNKAMRRAGDNAKDFWAIYPFLPAETRSYVPAFIAANYVMNYHKEHGIKPAVARKPIVTDSVHVKKRVYFQQIADVLNIPVEEIRILNPQYRKDYIPGDIKPYPLVLPSYQIYSYIMSEDSILARDASKYARRKVVEPSTGAQVVREDGDYIITETTKYHTVKKGDTFASLAKKYGVTANAIKRTNGIKTLKRGKSIKIVVTERTLKPKEELVPEELIVPVQMPDGTADASLSDSTLTDVNDALSAIETEETLPVSEDAEDATTETNDAPAKTETATPAKKTEEQAKPAQKPANTPNKTETTKAAQTSGQPVYHTVAKGESPYKIAKKYGTTTEKILKLNNLKPTSKIQIGDKIRVK
ncbi:MAG: transglycosylase SLT domain-containing protein [Muribaculaceae bacterium]|nr:transglycosylase SLT domain-containing protein [Muribaculaceae bacterium]